MAVPHFDDITGADRVLEEKLEPLTELTGYDGVACKLPDGWERGETDQNITYYISHIDGQTYWDHPEMIQLIEKFESFQEIKYSAYRTAMKLRAIQKLTHLSGVQLAVVKKALFQHGLTEAYNNTIISVIEMESVLVTLFNNTKLTWTNINPDYCTELTLNWILSCYDSGHTGKINIMQFKLALTTLCDGSLEQKYHYYFDQISQEGFVNRNILVHFIRDVIMIPAHLLEDSSFLTNNDETAAASSCLEFSGGHPSIRANDFVSWMMNEPKFIVWLPTMHRLAASETVKHEAKCSVCKMFPIVGLRFRSLKDFSTDFCQACYFSQKTTKNHKITHPVKEYCFATTTGDDVKDFAKVIRNKVSRRHRHKHKEGFLNYHSNDKMLEEEPVSQLGSVHHKIRLLAERLPRDDAEDEPDAPPMLITADEDHLSSKIAELEEENRQLLEEIASMRTMAPAGGSQEANEELTAKLEITQEYTKRLEGEINRLRMLLEQQQHVQQRPPSSISGSVSPRDFIGSEENEIDLLVQQMLQAFPTGQEPGVPVYIHDDLYQKMMTVSNTAAALAQDVVTCYTQHA